MSRSSRPRARHSAQAQRLRTLLWTGGLVLGIGILIGTGVGIFQEQILYTRYPEYYWQYAFVEDTLIAAPTSTFDPVMGRLGALLYGVLFGVVAGFWLTLGLIVFCLGYSLVRKPSESIVGVLQLALIGAIAGAFVGMVLSLGLGSLLLPVTPVVSSSDVTSSPAMNQAVLARVALVHGSTWVGAIMGQWLTLIVALRLPKS